MSSRAVPKRPRMPLRRVPLRWWLVPVVLVLVVAAWLRFEPGSATTTQRITTTVSRGTFRSIVSATGTITPVRSTDVAFTSAGTVTAVLVAEGDKVQKGDILAKIDPTLLLAQRDAAQAQLTAAQAQLGQDSSATSTQVAADDAAVASAESQLQQAQDALDNATLTAPFSGTVSSVSYAVGDRVGSAGGGSAGGGSSGGGSSGGGSATSASGTAASASSTSSASGITVISAKRLQVDADVSAGDVSRLKVGMEAQITPAGGGDLVYGTVSAIGSIAGTSTSGAAQFPVTIAITGTPAGLFAGATATVAITVKQATDVLAVPTQALHTSGQTTYVYVIEAGRRVRRTVAIGATYGAQTEVTSGVKEGDTVEVVTFTPRPIGGSTGRGGGLFQQNGNGTRGGGGFPRGGFSGNGFSGNGFSGGGFPGGPPNVGGGQ